MEEFRKVTWPTKNQAIKLTIITVIFTLITTAILAGTDILFKKGYDELLEQSNTVSDQIPIVQPVVEDEAIEEKSDEPEKDLLVAEGGAINKELL